VKKGWPLSKQTRLVDARQACCPLDTSEECTDKDCIETEVHYDRCEGYYTENKASKDRPSLPSMMSGGNKSFAKC
jgi:hypothetical protein